MQGPGRIVQFLEHLLVLAERVGAKSATRTCGMSIFGRMHGLHSQLRSSSAPKLCASSTSKMWCGRRDLNPHGPFKPCGFSYRLRLSPPEREDPWRGSRQVCGLDYPFTLPRNIRSLGAARLVSTPSRLVSVRAWLGIAILGFPEFEQFCIAGFPGEHSSFA